MKEGEDDAKAACSQLAEVQDDDISISEGLEGLIRAEAYADAAAAANDDYESLSSAVRAFNESMALGSEDLAQSAWSNVARVCSELF